MGMKTFKPSRHVHGKYDTVVIGGGLAGVCAAIAAVRNGCTVALVQDRPMLGGNASSEMRVNITGASHTFRYARESGIVEEIRIEDRFRNCAEHQVNGSISAIIDLVLWEWVERESNITLFLNATARKPIMASERLIQALVAEQLSIEKTLHLKADVFIDCSGDGLIAAEAGAEFRMGREARDEFGEDRAPAVADHCTLGSSLMFGSRDLGRPVRFERPGWARQYPTDADLPHRSHGRITSGFWWIEYGGMLDTIDDNEKIRDELLKHLMGVWDHIKNHGAHGAESYIIQWVAALPSKRESRRFVGDHMLTQGDIESATVFEDRVAYGGWPIDLHPPEGIYSTERPAHMPPLQEPYSIPFRCLCSRTIDNLMMAGRNISVSHVALGSTRVMGTCAIQGQAVGTAAALCKKHGVLPREVGRAHIRELQQQLLKDDAYIIGLRSEDPDDVARQATATASSERMLEVTEGESSVALDCPRGQMFIVTGERLDAVELLLESARSDDAEISLSLREASTLHDFGSEVDIAEAEAVVKAGESGWVRFELGASVTPGTLYWVCLPPVPGISWRHSELQLPGTNVGYCTADGWWRMGRGTHCFRLSPPSDPFGAANVINGVARPEEQPNIWISDPDEGLPQHIVLDFGEARHIDTVYLTFDTNLDVIVPEGAVPECVRDYVVYASVEDGWLEVARESGNHHRRRKHTFPSVSAQGLRIEVLATNGSPEARIYEVRGYREAADRM